MDLVLDTLPAQSRLVPDSVGAVQVPFWGAPTLKQDTPKSRQATRGPRIWEGSPVETEVGARFADAATGGGMKSASISPRSMGTLLVVV